MDQNRKFRKKTMHSQLIIGKIEKENLFSKVVLGKLDAQMQINEIGLLSYAITSKLAVNELTIWTQILKLKIPRRKQWKSSLMLVLADCCCCEAKSTLTEANKSVSEWDCLKLKSF